MGAETEKLKILKIDGASWHYKWLWLLGNPNYNRRPPKSLCSYFWGCALGSILLTCLAAILTVILTIGHVLFILPLLIVLAFRRPTNWCWSVIAIPEAVIGDGVIDFEDREWFANYKAGRKERKRERDRKRLAAQREANEAVEKIPSPFWEYIKAKKRRACPLVMVEFPEEPEEDEIEKTLEEQSVRNFDRVIKFNQSDPAVVAAFEAVIEANKDIVETLDRKAAELKDSAHA